MRVIGLAGWSGAGKTTLLTRLIPELGRRGVSVSTLKHAHHAFDLDTPGKDSHAHREAGAREVLISSERRWALMRELRGEAEAELPDLLVRLRREAVGDGVGNVPGAGVKRSRKEVAAWKSWQWLATHPGAWRGHDCTPVP